MEPLQTHKEHRHQPCRGQRLAFPKQRRSRRTRYRVPLYLLCWTVLIAAAVTVAGAIVMVLIEEGVPYHSNRSLQAHAIQQSALLWDV